MAASDLQTGRMMKTTGKPASSYLTAQVSSVLPDLHEVPLAEMAAENSAELSETLGRLLPPVDGPPVPVAAFNSSI
jgi:FXSXX-COOH protein